ncbi:MAG: S41 family peptidase [Ferruginibacter sp.]
MLLLSKYNSLLLLAIIFLQTGCHLKRNNTEQKNIKAAALKVDVDILVKTLEEAHPGLYWYSDKKDMDSYFDSVKASIKHDMTRIQFFKVLLPVIANINCVHTSLSLPKEISSTDVHQLTNLLPFDFFCKEGKVYIQKSFAGKMVEASEVLSINNIEMKEIISKLLQRLPADGYNETYKYHILTKGAFIKGYALFFGQPANFILQTKDSSNQLHTFSVQAISPKKHIPTFVTLPAFSLTFIKSTAILSLNSFEVETKKFKDSLETIFQAINQNGAKQLIIDIRKNGGGVNDNLSILYSFLATAPFQHLREAEMVASTLTYSSFISNYKSIARFSNGSKAIGVYSVNGKYAGTKTNNPVRQNLFNGNVILLTSGNTTSAASEFAAIFHFLQRGKIVGEETGGGYYGATGGHYLNLSLPNSGLEVRIPTIRIFTAVKEDFNQQPKGRGTFPDYQISPTINDILCQKDVQLDKALQVLTKLKNSEK